MSEMLEKILSNENIKLARKKVYSNKGASGVDGVTVQELEEYMKENWNGIKEQIRERKYKPQPVLRVEIPKPNGGVRKLGIPTVVDRVIEQAIVQVLTPIFDPMFSDNSYGFRPNRRCEQAIVKLLEYFNDGYVWIVDIDLEKSFDNVPQDKLMSYVGRVIHDGDTESLIRKCLKAGVMNKGTYEATDVGTPQGGNLSPLLSNIMLNELDKELESRGQRFTRYADDVVIVLKSKAAATRVMYSITDWIERKLGLKVNATKTKITPPSKLKYLGFGFWKDKTEWKARPHEDSVNKFKRKLKALCRRSWSVDLTYRIKKINEVTRGWINYFRIGSMKAKLETIDGQMRMRIIAIIWKQWKTRAIGFVGATTIASYVDDIERFDGDFKRFSSYLGIIPSVHNSADTVRMGHITKRGPQELRTAFVQVAMGIIRQPQNTSEWKLMKDYQTMKISKGSGRAIIALTRKVARIVFAMLNNKEAFNPELMRKATVA